MVLRAGRAHLNPTFSPSQISRDEHSREGANQRASRWSERDGSCLIRIVSIYGRVLGFSDSARPARLTGPCGFSVAGGVAIWVRKTVQKLAKRNPCGGQRTRGVKGRENGEEGGGGGGGEYNRHILGTKYIYGEFPFGFTDVTELRGGGGTASGSPTNTIRSILANSRLAIQCPRQISAKLKFTTITFNVFSLQQIGTPTKGTLTRSISKHIKHGLDKFGQLNISGYYGVGEVEHVPWAGDPGAQGVSLSGDVGDPGSRYGTGRGNAG